MNLTDSITGFNDSDPAQKLQKKEKVLLSCLGASEHELNAAKSRVYIQKIIEANRAQLAGAVDVLDLGKYEKADEDLAQVQKLREAIGSRINMVRREKVPFLRHTQEVVEVWLERLFSSQELDDLSAIRSTLHSKFTAYLGSLAQRLRSPDTPRIKEVLEERMALTGELMDVFFSSVKRSESPLVAYDLFPPKPGEKRVFSPPLLLKPSLSYGPYTSVRPDLKDIEHPEKMLALIQGELNNHDGVLVKPPESAKRRESWNWLACYVAGMNREMAELQSRTGDSMTVWQQRLKQWDEKSESIVSDMEDPKRGVSLNGWILKNKEKFAILFSATRLCEEMLSFAENHRLVVQRHVHDQMFGAGPGYNQESSAKQRIALRLVESLIHRAGLGDTEDFTSPLLEGEGSLFDCDWNLAQAFSEKIWMMERKWRSLTETQKQQWLEGGFVEGGDGNVTNLAGPNAWSG